MTRLRLSFLGAPEVRRADEVLTFRTRKALALLVYLAVEGGYQPREKLIALLWSESDDRRGQMSLRRALASLRKSLSDVAASFSPPVLVDGDRLSFDFDSNFELDVAVLAAAARTANANSGQASSQLKNLEKELQTAVDRYRGDFLEGFNPKNAKGFDEWASQERERCHRQMTSILDRLSQLQMDSGQLQRALGTSIRWVAHNNLNEVAHRRLMRVHFAAGDRTAALEAYEACYQVLLAELSLEPSPETSALAERMSAEAPPARRRQAGSTQAIPPPLQKPFVGRAEEHSRLVELYFAARQGQAKAVVILGETGIGKTRLATEFLGWSEAHGAQILSSRAIETGGNLPYQPWTELLRSPVVWHAASPDLVGETWLGELSWLLPGLLDRYPGISPLKVDVPASQTRLFESVTLLCEELAHRVPLVIFMDDLQWADSASRDLLHYAARRWNEGKAPVLLVIGLRSEALGNGQLSEWLARLERDAACSRLNIGPLRYAATCDWVTSLAASGTDPGSLDLFSRWLHDETGGQPFYIQAMLESLLEQGLLHAQADGVGEIEFPTAASEMQRLQGHIPLGVRQVILARLAPLDPNARALLFAGAVLGHRLGLDLLCQVADLSESEGLRALDRLLTSSLLLEEPGDEGQSVDQPYSFSHDKIRDVAYTEAGSARRRIFHQRALEALSNSAVPLAELARHAFAGGLMEPAYRYSVAAGDEAMSMAAANEALTSYIQAHELIEQRRVERLKGEQLIHLYINLGRALELNGRFPEALEKYEELGAFGQQYGDRGVELAALLAQVTLFALPTSLSDPIRAKSLSEQALAISRELDDQAAEARLLWCLSHVYRGTNRLAEAIEAGERSLALARSLKLREQIAYTLNDLGTHGYFLSGRMSQASTALHEASEMWKSLGNLPMQVDSLASMALVSSFMGKYAQVLAFAEEAYRISKSTGNLWGQAFSRMAVGQVLWEHGQTDQAIAAMEESIHMSESAGFSVPPALTRADLAALYGDLGAIEHGLELAHLALDSSAAPIPHTDLYIHAVMADLHMLDGRLTQAETTLKRAEPDRDLDVFPVFLVRAMLANCELALRQAQYNQALEVSDNIMTKLSQSELLAYLPRTQHLRGQVLLELGQREAAKKCLIGAMEAAESLSSRRWLLPILVLLSQLEENPDEVQKLRRRARGIAEFILSNTGESELRASFCSLDYVRAVLEDER